MKLNYEVKTRMFKFKNIYFLSFKLNLKAIYTSIDQKYIWLYLLKLVNNIIKLKLINIIIKLINNIQIKR